MLEGILEENVLELRSLLATPLCQEVIATMPDQFQFVGGRSRV